MRFENSAIHRVKDPLKEPTETIKNILTAWLGDNNILLDIWGISLNCVHRETNVKQDKILSLREAVSKQTRCEKQGFRKCSFGVNKYQINRWRCYEKVKMTAHISLSWPSKSIHGI
ncbi:hypothetical protein CHS0354_037728 [Potamilus streckersoni]|uniref:Uncharacterized protein n=1 Tax=Potamilus streckersoni TaxID=2493646 RepID=A0AAE0T0F4_9BIVA|nr:hypothetical protein CHS0354_037728 [Potamilus streckersoni]